jgi:diamine N-acetyltransferase
MPTFVPQAIYARVGTGTDETLVGFAMYGYYPNGAPPLGLRHWIFRLMVAHEYQGRGYGTAALRAIIALLEADPACDDVLIGYEPDNAVARALYARLGFVEQGQTPWGELYACRATTTPK